MNKEDNTPHQVTTTQSGTPFQAATKSLTRKQQIFVNHILENPSSSATQAAKVAYPNATYGTQRMIATENLTKPNIVMALSKANDLVENTLINTVQQWQNEDNTRKREIAVDTAKYIHDKIHGKAKQSMDIQSTSVNLNIDLSSE